MFGDTKGIIRSHKSKKVGQYNGQGKKDKTRNMAQKTKDCATHTTLKTRG